MTCSQPQNSSHRKIASNLLFVDGEFRRCPIVEVDGAGVVLSVEYASSREEIDRTPNTEFYAGLMTAGFVNAHCHLELSYLRGKIDPYIGFDGFAQQIGRVRGEATQAERLTAVAREDIAMRNEGIAAVGDVANGESSMACKAESPIYYHTFAEVFGLSTTSLEAVQWAENYPNRSLTPHSIYSLNDNIFRDIATSSGNAPLSIHFMESDGEGDLFQRKGRLWDWYSRVGFECDFLNYGSPAERIIASVPKDRSVMLVHNCCVTDRDIELIMNHFTAEVYWVVCPRSNEYISRLKPSKALFNKGLNLCIGTDSLASNWSLSMLEEMRLLADISDLTLAETLTAATMTGAKALGLSDILGDITVGKRPKINILSGLDFRSMRLTNETKIQNII
ncbi:MAG: amidohydrolase family protein [Rikenellaceae bacterium]